MTIEVSKKLVEFVATFEGFSERAYWDLTRWSIGYGTGADGPNDTITKAQAQNALAEELDEVLDWVPRIRRLKQQEVDALASFGYNLGPRALDDADYSSLARRLKSGEGRAFEDRRDIYHDELRKWCMPGTKYEAGLYRRRMCETKMARNGTYETTY